MSEVQIREAVLDDIPSILEIVNHYIAHDTCIYDIEPRAIDFQIAWFEIQMNLGNPVLVAEENSKLLGFASYAQFRPKVGYKFSMEHSVYLHPSEKGRGIGKLLLLSLINKAKQQNIHALIGGIDATNIDSIEFHKKLGFEVVGKMNEVGYKFNKWLDLVWMQKII